MHFYELQTAGATSITNVEVFFLVPRISLPSSSARALY